MITLAVILFPGLNTEQETCREIRRAGMKAVKFRWNEPLEKLSAFDGYVIGGGFAFEDRGRAGIIAALDPLMETLKTEAAKGKPVLGICNGAQILVESGLIPGADGGKIALALARNKRMVEGKVLGTGYYNAWTTFKCSSAPKNSLFTWDMQEGERLRAPIAHGEGRFTSEIPGLMLALKENGQLPFRYCDEHGVITEDFPINPNGAQFNAAAICNPEGNVMAIMPHLERAEAASHKLFTSLRKALEEKVHPMRKARRLTVKELPVYPLKFFSPASVRTVELFISLIITDNEAHTHAAALKRLGFGNVGLARGRHIEIEYKGKPALDGVARKIIQSGALLNTNKEEVMVKIGKKLLKYDARRQTFVPCAAPEFSGAGRRIVVREKSDFVGMSKLAVLNGRMKMNEITGITTGTLWMLDFPTKSEKVAEADFKKILQTHLFYNPHRQSTVLY